MLGMALKMAKWFLALLSLFVVTFFAVRIYNSQRGLPLDVWHTYVPQELSKTEIDAADWESYLEAEAKIFASLRTNVSQQLTPEEQVPFNRYFEGSPVYPGHFSRDWNRSYLLEPAGPPIGAVVLLHGLTDSPYSLRHIASRYRDRGFAVVAIRLPAHGTVPAALTKVEWETWLAATRLAVREARRRAPGPAPLHVVGFLERRIARGEIYARCSRAEGGTPSGQPAGRRRYPVPFLLFCPGCGADYNQRDGLAGPVRPSLSITMPILWLRVALGCYAVGLLYALLALTRTSSLLNRIAMPAMSLGMIFHFVSLTESVLLSGQLTLASVHNAELAAGAADHGGIHDCVSGLSHDLARHRGVSAGFPADFCLGHRAAADSADYAVHAQRLDLCTHRADLHRLCGIVPELRRQPAVSDLRSAA